MKIADNVYSLDSTRGCSAYIIKGSETVMIDTGFPGIKKSVLRELESMKINPGDIKHILLTHHDIDHIGLVSVLQELTGARVWASREDIPYITGALKRHGIKGYLPGKAIPPENITAYEAGQKIGGIEVIPTPGHTPGHVCLLYKDILFAGDLLLSQRSKLRLLPGFITWSRSQLQQSLQRIAEVPFQWICPSHGRPEKRSGVW